MRHGPHVPEYTPFPELLGLQQDYTFSEFGVEIFGDEMIFGFNEVGGGFVGPFGIGALILSMFLPLGFALFFSMVFKDKTKDLIKERNKTKQLEREFTNSLFQLGNRLGNGMPPELVFGKVAESSKGLKTEDFFRRVNYNIRQMGIYLMYNVIIKLVDYNEKIYEIDVDFIISLNMFIISNFNN